MPKGNHFENGIWLPRVNTNHSQICRNGGETLCCTDGYEKERKNIEIAITIFEKIIFIIPIFILAMEDMLVAKNIIAIEVNINEAVETAIKLEGKGKN